MRPEEGDPAFLWDMGHYAELARAMTAGTTLDRYLADETLRLAVERSLEIVGEAAGRVSAAFQVGHPEIVWSRIVGLRNVIVHGYTKIDHEIIWNIVTAYVPELIHELEPLIPPLSPDGA